MNVTDYYQIYGSSRYFNDIEKNYYMIFIRDLKEWSTKQLYNVIYLNTRSQFDLLFSIKKKCSPKYGSYFAIKVNAPNQHSLISFILTSIERLPITSKIGWKRCSLNSSYHRNSVTSNKVKCKNKFKPLDTLLNPMPQDFFSSHLSPNSVYFNLCASWNINGWNSEKKKTLLYILIQSLNLYTSVFRKLSVVSSSTKNIHPQLS